MVAASLLLAVPPASLAQDADATASGQAPAGDAAEAATAGAGPAPLDEIVVTARKTTESLNDAPLSAVVLDGGALAEQGVNRIEELVAYVPNVAMSETGIGTNLYVRGIGSGINQGFEQSVGLYIDGIYYGRAQLTRVPFMDLAQAESLRGPQAILLGNNSIAGAINLVTARPTREFESAVSLLYEPDQGEEEISAYLSGPLTERLSARLSGRYRSFDGYVKNVTLGGRDEPERDEKSLRLTLDWDADGWDASLKLEHDSFDVKGRQIEIIRADPATTRGSSQTGFSNNTGSAGLWQPGRSYLEYLDEFFDDSPGIQGNPSLGDGHPDYRRGANGDSSDNDVDAAVLTLNWDLDGYQLTSVTGYLTYDYSELCDCDFTGAPMFSLLSEESYDQWSQELRLASPQSERLRWLAGLYYQHDELGFGDQIFLPADSGVVKLVGYATQGDPAGAIDSLGNTSAFRNFDQNNTVSSLFGQLAYELTERWRASLGLRYSHMEKEATRILREGDLERRPFVLGVQPDEDLLTTGAPLFASIFNVAFHSLAGHRTENSTAFELVTDFDLTPDVMVYGSVKTGFKSGGFDARSNSEPVPGTSGAGFLYPADPATLSAVQNVDPGSFEFEDEKATSWETGSKMQLLGDTAEISIALFYTTFDNLQVSIFDGTLGFNVGNAAKATSQGVELDGRWAISDRWSMNGSLGYLDFDFDEFPNGQCNQGQAPDDPATGKCSYDGKSNQYVARWSGNLALTYQRPVGELELRSTLDMQFSDAYNPSQNLDPRVEQDAYATWNLRLALGDAAGRWELALLGRNLTDEKIISYANDTPLAFSQFGAPTFYGFIDRPRNVALQASYRFGD